MYFCTELTLCLSCRGPDRSLLIVFIYHNRSLSFITGFFFGCVVLSGPFCIDRLVSVHVLTPASVDKEKANVERKGPAPGRGSLNEPAPLSVPKKPVSSPTPVSLPVLEVSDGAGNNISATNSPETSYPDGELKHESWFSHLKTPISGLIIVTTFIMKISINP